MGNRKEGGADLNHLNVCWMDVDRPESVPLLSLLLASLALLRALTRQGRGLPRILASSPLHLFHLTRRHLPTSTHTYNTTARPHYNSSQHYCLRESMEDFQDDLHLELQPPSRKRTASSPMVGSVGRSRKFRLAPRPEPFEHMASAIESPESPTTIIADAKDFGFECGFKDLTLQDFAAGQSSSISLSRGASDEPPTPRPSGPTAGTAAIMTPMPAMPPAPLRASPPRARLVQRRRAAPSMAVAPTRGVVTLEVLTSSGGLLFPRL